MNTTDSSATMMQYDVHKKSPAVAYLLWFFLGEFGAHRFYMGRIWSGIAMALLLVASAVLLLIFIGVFGLLACFVWWIIDAFLLNNWIKEHNSLLASALTYAD
jgi:TM2 domain-containing membrane protein YozV